MKNIKTIISQHLIQKVLLANAAFALFNWVLFVATPFDIIASNPDEFALVSSPSILRYGIQDVLYYWGMLNIALLIIVALLKEYVQKLLLFLFFALGILAWLDATFLFISYGAFDGRENIGINRLSVLTFVQVGVFLLLLLAAFFFRKNLKILIYAVCFPLLISIVTGVFNIAPQIQGAEDAPQASVVRDDSGAVLLSEAELGFFTYSSNKANVLMIVLDEFQSDFFGNMIDDETKAALQGFTWYSDASSNFPRTISSLPAFLTGEVYQNDSDIKTFYKTMGQNSIAGKVSDAGGRVSYAPAYELAPAWAYENLFPRSSPTNFSLPNNADLLSYTNLLNYSVFRAVPDFVKPTIYNKARWVVRLKDRDDPYLDLGWTGSSFKKLRYMASTKPMVRDDYPITFKFHHSAVTHGPTRLDENCVPLDKSSSSLAGRSAEGRCAIGKIVEIINNLKDIGVFDNTMIVVLSDHGAYFKPDSFDEPYPYPGAASTLLIKPFAKTSEFAIDDYPAQLSDVPKTIAQALAIKQNYPGVDLLSNGRVQPRTRLFHYHSWGKKYWAWGRKRVSDIETYEINGKLNDPLSWSSLEK